MRIAVVGAGSAGQRHARILKQLGHEIVVVSKHDQSAQYEILAEALKVETFEYVIISSNTSQHFSDLEHLCENNFTGKVLVEKPLLSKPKVIPENNFSLSAVGYNLRFHPAVKWLIEALPKLGPISSANFYVGQYLPNWRPSIDYRTSSSALTTSGGGVLRDLSHELDLVQYLFGEWQCLTAMGGKLSDLEIETQDTFAIIMKTLGNTTISLQLNYLDQISQRTATINGNRGTIAIDFLTGITKLNDEVHEFTIESDKTYFELHQAIIASTTEHLCNFDQAMSVVNTIDAIETSSSEKRWIIR